jgi:protein TonB
MRSSLIISLTFHLLITIIATNWVSFRQVNFVPRQVYAVDLVTATEVKKEKAEPPPVEPEMAPPEPEQKPDEMEPPPEKPKKKKPEKKKKKTVPTTQIEKTLPKQQPVDETQTSTPETGEMAFDAEDFPFAHYIGRMRRKIAAHWRVPEGSQGQDRFCRVYFRVMRDGSVVSVGIEESSGLFIFDQAAQRAVHQAAPMPPLPQEYRENYLGVHFSFSYKER